ncbi:MAG: peptidase M3, partial [Alphaproteobacteria bacterium]|nr:peptidase M3 [Alphaproteobacteria bacterium]
MCTSLFEGLKTPRQTYPFDLIKTEDYKPAFQKGFELHNKEIDQIVQNAETPTFSNTIEAFERSGGLLSSVQSVFYNLLEAESSPEMHEIAEEISPIETDHYTNIYMDERLFERVKHVDVHKDEFHLS